MLTWEPAKQEDIGLLYTLNKQLIDQYEDIAAIDYPNVLIWLQSNLDRNIGTFTRVLWDGELAGFYRLDLSGEKAELDSLFVLEPFRGRGIGTEILRKCQGACPSLFLYVFKQNAGAIRLYRRMGFRIAEEVSATRCIMKYKNQGC